MYIVIISSDARRKMGQQCAVETQVSKKRYQCRGRQAIIIIIIIIIINWKPKLSMVWEAEIPQCCGVQ